MIPLKAVTSWHPVIGPQAVNHINQFTSVTMFFNLKPGFAIGPATQLRREARPSRFCLRACGAQLQGEALTFQQHGSRPGDPDAGRRVRHVRDPGDSVRELPAPDHGAFVAAGGAAGRTAYALALRSRRPRSTPIIGMFMLMGIVKKNGIMIVDFADTACPARALQTTRPFTTPAWSASGRS